MKGRCASNQIDAIEAEDSGSLYGDLQRARRAAEEANRTKSRFLAIMSHEIRTPLNGVLGALQLLGDASPDSRQQELIDLARSSAESLRRVTDDIIDLSRLEAGGLQLEAAPFDIAALLRDVSAFWQPMALDKGISIRPNVDGKLPRQLSGDSARIRQILNNFLSNAIKFTDQGSIDISVESDHTLCLEAEDTVGVRIEVRDTGIGIARQDLKGLFTDYAQIKNSAHCRRSGAGLGLAICRELANCMGGSVGVTSTPASGSTFWARLPLKRDKDLSSNARPAQSPVKPAPLFTEAGGRPNILLVEDSETNQLIARAFLEGFGCRVDVAEDGMDALTAVQNKDYDIILMDVAMPNMDGLEATREIRAMRGSFARVPIIGQTAFVTEAETLSFLAAGMNHVVNKPLDREFLHGVLQGALASASAEPNHAEVPEPLSEYVDTAVLDKLRQDLSNDQLDSLLARVVIDLDTTALEALAGAKEGETRALARACHTLKGLGASFGSPKLESISSEILGDCRRDEAARAIATALSRLGGVCEKSIVALKTYRQMVHSEGTTLPASII